MMRPQTIDSLPRVAFVATGGTIAGELTEASAAGDIYAYDSARRSGESLVMAIPGLLRRAQWHFEQPFSIGSQNIELAHMLQLRAVLIRLLESSEVDGIVVTHGTDTMEDTLYFLHLTLPSHLMNKPVLFTGAMLPSDHDQADGPSNIGKTLDFLIQCVEASQNEIPFGLVMQGLFTPAHCVEKQSTSGLDVFDGPYSVPADAQWLVNWTGLNSPDDLGLQGQYSLLFESNASQHPLFEAMEVPVVYCTPGNAALRQLNDLLNRKPASVVVAAPGHGNIPDVCVPALRRLLLNGVGVVRASRVSAGGVQQGGEFDALDNFREGVNKPGFGIFSEAGSLSLSKCVMYERLRVLAHSLSV
ncbi:asparaginase domain-containing protein [Limnobacter parvus]|uniref:Asparaginase domain-containing protein n=1 Tax=Limnobacter parvus TaxID=2939690 RepID=A0ABT1XIZ5_9BURK|nr:asparaginase domain-containing protein [Limnobacter parvus]MCR2746874.1 asparaginase domain-containing protein [Limnobacter parvus]